MKKINAYEFKELSKGTQIVVWRNMIELQIEIELDCLAVDLEEGRITEKEFYEILGCSKYYADTTSWFVPSCYYENNKKEINITVKNCLAKSLFTVAGRFIETQ